jgi:hypothetical protein
MATREKLSSSSSSTIDGCLSMDDHDEQLNVSHCSYQHNLFYYIKFYMGLYYSFIEKKLFMSFFLFILCCKTFFYVAEKRFLESFYTSFVEYFGPNKISGKSRWTVLSFMSVLMMGVVAKMRLPYHETNVKSISRGKAIMILTNTFFWLMFFKG